MESPTAKEFQAQLASLAKEAGQIALRYYGRVGVELKSNNSVVTAADREVETFLLERLPPLIPGSVFVGEEMAREPHGIEAARKAEWIWVVDPIDGTAGFLDGLDLFCVCIGLLHQGRPHSGLLFFPALGHLYSAVHGSGAEYDGRRISVLREPPIADRRALYVDAYSHLRLQIRFTGKTRSMASTALHLGLVARGVGVGALSSGHVWDYAAAAAILEESGGVLKHLDGRPLDWLKALDGTKVTPPVLGAPAGMWDDIAGSISLK
jgi:myo-inositol-1(or 4)-monophosphatase